jgi:hypothetical protein
MTPTTPTLKPVHVKQGKTIVEYNPIREFGGFGRRGQVFKLQGSNWFSATGRPLTEDQVPEAVRRHVAENPAVSHAQSSRVAEVCEHCGETFYAEELRTHLLELWKQATANPQASPAAAPTPLRSTAYVAADDVPPSASALG